MPVRQFIVSQIALIEDRLKLQDYDTARPFVICDPSMNVLIETPTGKRIMRPFDAEMSGVIALSFPQALAVSEHMTDYPSPLFPVHVLSALACLRHMHRTTLSGSSQQRAGWRFLDAAALAA